MKSFKFSRGEGETWFLDLHCLLAILWPLVFIVHSIGLQCGVVAFPGHTHRHFGSPFSSVGSKIMHKSVASSAFADHIHKK